MILAANWKMYGNQALLKQWSESLATQHDHEFILFPPATLFASALAFEGYDLGAQNMHEEDQGAYTGELSAVMLLEAKVKWVLLGHSERRLYCAETDEKVAKKWAKALQSGLKPMVCVGESLADREAGLAIDAVANQIKKCLENLPKQNDPLIIAYEPLWAIGSGLVPSVADIDQMHGLIQSVVADHGHQAKVLYGGSVKPSNAAKIAAIGSVGGLLIGGASLKIDDFNEVVRLCTISSCSRTS